MSAVVPTIRDEMIEFYQYHEPIWQAAGESIGLSIAQATELKARVNKALESQAAVIAARQNAKTLTLQLNADAAALRSYGAGLMSTIRGYAEQQPNPSATYVAAEIPAPKPATPAPPPVAPSEFNADPNADGTITLRMKGSVAQNGSFDIERSIDGGPFAFIKNTRQKTWKDSAVPMNSNTITYRCYGVRDDVRSAASASATVNFGNLPAALQAAFRSDAGPKREAA